MKITTTSNKKDNKYHKNPKKKSTKTTQKAQINASSTSQKGVKNRILILTTTLLTLLTTPITPRTVLFDCNITDNNHKPSPKSYYGRVKIEKNVMDEYAYITISAYESQTISASGFILAYAIPNETHDGMFPLTYTELKTKLSSSPLKIRRQPVYARSYKAKGQVGRVLFKDAINPYIRYMRFMDIQFSNKEPFRVESLAQNLRIRGKLNQYDLVDGFVEIDLVFSEFEILSGDSWAFAMSIVSLVLIGLFNFGMSLSYWLQLCGINVCVRWNLEKKEKGVIKAYSTLSLSTITSITYLALWTLWPTFVFWRFLSWTVIPIFGMHILGLIFYFLHFRKWCNYVDTIRNPETNEIEKKVYLTALNFQHKEFHVICFIVYSLIALRLTFKNEYFSYIIFLPYLSLGVDVGCSIWQNFYYPISERGDKRLDIPLNFLIIFIYQLPYICIYYVPLNYYLVPNGSTWTKYLLNLHLAIGAVFLIYYIVYYFAEKASVKVQARRQRRAIAPLFSNSQSNTKSGKGMKKGGEEGNAGKGKIEEVTGGLEGESNHEQSISNMLENHQGLSSGALKSQKSKKEGNEVKKPKNGSKKLQVFDEEEDDPYRFSDNRPLESKRFQKPKSPSKRLNIRQVEMEPFQPRQESPKAREYAKGPPDEHQQADGNPLRPESPPFLEYDQEFLDQMEKAKASFRQRMEKSVKESTQPSDQNTRSQNTQPSGFNNNMKSSNNEEKSSSRPRLFTNNNTQYLPPIAARNKANNADTLNNNNNLNQGAANLPPRRNKNKQKGADSGLNSRYKSKKKSSKKASNPSQQKVIINAMDIGQGIPVELSKGKHNKTTKNSKNSKNKGRMEDIKHSMYSSKRESAGEESVSAGLISSSSSSSQAHESGFTNIENEVMQRDDLGSNFVVIQNIDATGHSSVA